jgi:2-polyprenyl-3-methyl-5-hydroxy-6-metoxy-1,4-benzoquinol methylase
MRPPLISVSCDLCGGGAFEKILSRDHNGFACHVCVCRSCGLGMLNPRWSRELYARFYREQYDRFYRGTLGDDLLKLEVETKGKPMLERIAPRLKGPEFDVLDIGCGLCWSFEVLSSVGRPSIDVIESSPGCLERVHRLPGVRLVSRNLDGAWDENPGRYDLVIARHVLEHVFAPVEFLEKIKRVLKPEGIVYLAVPNALEGDDRKAISWFRNVHLYYFNAHTLERICNRAGLQFLDYGEREEIWAVLGSADASETKTPAVAFEEQVDALCRLSRIRRKAFLRKAVSDPRWLLYRALNRWFPFRSKRSAS